MAITASEGICLGAAKEADFLALLKRLIRVEFGSQAKYAAAAGITPGRVSQVLGGHDAVGGRALSVLTAPFVPSLRRVLALAWAEAAAVSGEDDKSVPRNDDHAGNLLAVLPELIAAGASKAVLGELLAARRSADLETWFALTRAATELALRLQRPGISFRLAEEIVSRAKTSGEPAWRTRGGWLAACAVRVMPNPSLPLIASVHEASARGFEEWSPTSDAGKAIRADFRCAAARDWALAAVMIHEQKPVFPGELMALCDGIDRVLAVERPGETCVLSLEVKGRVLLAMGDVVGAEEALEQAGVTLDSPEQDHSIKTMILQARIAAARKDRDAAMAAADKALTKCWETDNLHHALVAERILSGVLAEQPRFKMF